MLEGLVLRAHYMYLQIIYIYFVYMCEVFGGSGVAGKVQ